MNLLPALYPGLNVAEWKKELRSKIYEEYLEPFLTQYSREMTKEQIVEICNRAEAEVEAHVCRTMKGELL
jgi:hypothetical protein